jgi:hypothetical protein
MATASSTGDFADSLTYANYATTTATNGTATLSTTIDPSFLNTRPDEPYMRRLMQEEMERHARKERHEMQRHANMKMGIDPAMFPSGGGTVKKTPKTPLDQLRRSVDEWLNPTLRLLSV